MNPDFPDRLTGSLCGVAIGDGMGAPVEGISAQDILGRFGKWDFDVFLPPTDWKPTSPKGHGRITDDTLMTEALIRAYIAAGEHLDAYGFRDFLLPEMCDRKVWVPELQRETAIIERLNYLEKYAQFRLRFAGAEPRLAGDGNGINCAIAMFIMPVGAVNAGDPYAAYHEAAEFGMAESHAHAVEGAAVLAAAYAEALGADGTVDSVVKSAAGLAREGTRIAIQAALDVCDPADSLETWIARTRAAVSPYCPENGQPLEEVLDPGARARIANLPDPRVTFEELPVALAALGWGRGDFRRTLRAGVCYGRDCDSIAGMACGLCGALTGRQAITVSLITASEEANRRDWGIMARAFATAIGGIWTNDQRRFARRQQAFAQGMPLGTTEILSNGDKHREPNP